MASSSGSERVGLLLIVCGGSPLFNVLCHSSDGDWEAAVVAAGLPCADALRPVVSEVVSRAPPQEQSMGWVVLVSEDALGFPTTA